MTQDEIKKILHYNPDTGIFTRIKSGKIIGTINKGGYCVASIDYKQYKLHRLAFLYVYGYMPKLIDHINGIPHDNRISNLREVTRCQNAMNRKIHTNNKTGIKGVYWNKSCKKWLAQIQIGNFRKYLGLFDDLELAELVANEARLKYYGKFNRET